MMNDQLPANLELDNQVEQVQDVTMSNSVSENKRVRVEARAVNEVVASEYTSSSVLKKDDESEFLAEKSMPSEEKHAIRIEVYFFYLIRLSFIFFVYVIGLTDSIKWPSLLER